jgi:Tol biopolymer transport system component
MAKMSMKLRRWRGGLVVTSIALGAALVATGAAARKFGDWSEPVSAEQGSHPEVNTASNDGCPILSPDGLSLYMASNRPGGLGGQDIWVVRRRDTRSGWGAPINLGAPVNSPQDDFCPTPVRGKRLFFVSRRSEPNGDIYVTRLGRNGWMQPIHLGPNINSPAQEWSPSYFEDESGRPVLYFASTRSGGPGAPTATDQDIYYSVDFGPAQLAPGALNTEFDDARPNVRKDGLEIVFDSNRPGGLGATDIWTATRKSTRHPWLEPVHIPEINSAAGESRASLSWDGSIMVFGSGRPGGEGMADIYVTRTEKLRGGDDD